MGEATLKEQLHSHDAICMTCSTSEHCQGLRGRGEDDYQGKSMKECSGVDVTVLYSAFGDDYVNVCTRVKIHRTVQASPFH